MVVLALPCCLLCCLCCTVAVSVCAGWPAGGWQGLVQCRLHLPSRLQEQAAVQVGSQGHAELRRCSQRDVANMLASTEVSVVSCFMLIYHTVLPVSVGGTVSSLSLTYSGMLLTLPTVAACCVFMLCPAGAVSTQMLCACTSVRSSGRVASSGRRPHSL